MNKPTKPSDPTAATRMERMRARRKRDGLVLVQVWCSRAHAQAIKDYAARKAKDQP